MLYENEYGININDATYSINTETNSVDRKIFKEWECRINKVKKEDFTQVSGEAGNSD